MRRAFHEAAEVVVFLFFLVCMLALLPRCTPTELGATAAESAYTADLLRCVDEANTLAESRACRERVNARWKITETARKDGGQ